MKPGDEIEVDVVKFADRGKSVAYLDGFVVFVEGGVPGDRVRARVLKRRRKYAEARLLNVLEQGSLHAVPRCEYFGVCGGCKWQHVQYAAQLEAKRQSVADALAHLGGFRNVEVAPTLPSDRTYFYRNKMEFTFSAGRWLTREEIESGTQYDTSFAVGLHVREIFSKVLDIRACYLQSELAVRILNTVRDFSLDRGWEPWDVTKQAGYLRHLVIRHGEMTGETMINLVTYSYEPDRMAALANLFQRSFPEVTTFVNTINTGLAQTVYGEEIITIYGPGVIHDKIGPYRFEIAPNAFFQTNTAQAMRLYDVVRTFARLKPTDHVYDLYCGAGTISLYLSAEVNHVVGVELVEEAVVNARRNAAANGVENCTFISGDLMRLFTPDFILQHGHPDVLIVDPPRGGMHPRVVEQIARMRPDRFVYVSCNPQTQARDLALLGGLYQIEAVQPVDLFPHTHHIESVALLTPAR